MKITKISMVVSLLLLFAAAYSQTKKETFVLSVKTDVNLLFSNTTSGRDSIATNKIKNDQFGFNAGVGYFVADNFVIALSGTYSYSYTRIEPGFVQRRGSENITTTLGIVPELSYYFPLEGKLRPSLNIGAGYVWLKERDSKVVGNSDIVYSLSGPSYNGGAGLSYFITRNVAFEFGIQYTRSSLRDKARINEIEKQNSLGATLGVSVFL